MRAHMHNTIKAASFLFHTLHIYIAMPTFVCIADTLLFFVSKTLFTSCFHTNITMAILLTLLPNTFLIFSLLWIQTLQYIPNT
jgi:lipopolysaccharide export LptBFGC system permease protein LptF